MAAKRNVGHRKDDTVDAARLARLRRRAQYRIDDRMAADQQRSGQQPRKQLEHDSKAPGLGMLFAAARADDSTRPLGHVGVLHRRVPRSYRRARSFACAHLAMK